MRTWVMKSCSSQSGKHKDGVDQKDRPYSSSDKSKEEVINIDTSIVVTVILFNNFIPSEKIRSGYFLESLI